MGGPPSCRACDRGHRRLGHDHDDRHACARADPVVVGTAATIVGGGVRPHCAREIAGVVHIRTSALKCETDTLPRASRTSMPIEFTTRTQAHEPATDGPATACGLESSCSCCRAPRARKRVASAIETAISTMGPPKTGPSQHKPITGSCWVLSSTTSTWGRRGHKHRQERALVRHEHDRGGALNHPGPAWAWRRRASCSPPPDPGREDLLQPLQEATNDTAAAR